MEFFALIIAVIIYQWIAIPLTKKKIGFMRDDSNPLFYDYKTKWQMYFEIGVSISAVLLAIVFAKLMGIYSALFIPIGFIAIFIVRGILEKKYMADYKHHVISFIHALAIFLAFAAVLVMAIIK